MAKTKNPEFLAKRERVKATVDLRGVPMGTEGSVIISHGIDWIRYWVNFDNGVEMGSIHRDNLVRVAEWDTYLVDRAEAEARAAAAAEAGDADDAEGGAAAASGDGVVVNGVQVPQLLIDRANAALQRFGVTR